MRQRGSLGYVMIILISIVGLVNFFAPFFLNYKTDPLITYMMMGTASAIAGFKGVGLTLLNKLGTPKEPTEEKKE